MDRLYASFSVKHLHGNIVRIYFKMPLSHRSSHSEEERRSSSSALMLPEPCMEGIVVEPVPGAFYRHQSVYKTEKGDALGRSSRVEATRYEKIDAEGKHLETVI